MQYLQQIKNYITTRNIFVLFGVLIIFFVALKPPIDPDLGWHLGDGVYLFTHNFIPAHHDIFSFSVPNFPLIMHEWLTDILLYWVYANLGILPLTILFALITTAAFLLVSSGLPMRREYKIIAAMLGAIASVPILGLRAQMISLLGLALVIFIIFRFRRRADYKGIYFFPLIFAVWANLHGGFAVGLFFLAVYTAVEFAKIFLAWLLKKKKENMSYIKGWLAENVLAPGRVARLAGIFLLSCFATLLNPYGWRIYIEIVSTIFDKYAKQIIGEWMPVTAANPMSHQFLIYLALLGILLLFSWRKIDVTYFLVSIPFLFLAFSSWRHMPLFLMVSNPFWVGIVEHLTGRELLKMISRKWALALMLIAVVFIARQQGKEVWDRTRTAEKLAGGDYPFGAVEYLKSHPIVGNMLNEYNWGGYLIWRYPERKVFIDGRMPSWNMGGFRIFEEFSKIMGADQGWEDEFKKYDFRFALLYNNDYNDIKFKYLGWKKVYGDDLASVYEPSK